MASHVDNGIDDPTPPPPPVHNVWEPAEGLEVTYLVRTPWQWVMRKAKTRGMVEVDSAQDLPSTKLVKEGKGENGVEYTPSTRRRRQKSFNDRAKGPCTLKIEASDRETGAVLFAVHGTSSALDGLEDKDELVRTIQRCRCDQLNLSPPSILINWDCTREECFNVVGEHMPVLPNNGDGTIAVLKEPMGSQGKGIYFVRDADEIHAVISEHRQRALEEPQFLDDLIQAKGRIPSWVLQAEVSPPLLVCGGRKFHIRTYVVVVELPHLQRLLDVYIFNRHEVRIAGTPIKEGTSERDSLAHITNGALSTTTERILVDDVPELVSRSIGTKVEAFVAETLARHLLPDIERRVGLSINQLGDSAIRQFAIAGLDLMITEDDQIFLLEANVHPAAPPEPIADLKFSEHLQGFFHDLVELVVGRDSPNFRLARGILEGTD